MDICKKVAKMRLYYHMNMLDVNNVLNQLKLRSDNKAEECAKNHFMNCVDCLNRLGYDTDHFVNKKES